MMVLKLKQILQFKYLLMLLAIVSFLYVFIVTKIIKYESIYTNETVFNGIVNDYFIDGNKIMIELKSSENIIGTYYIKSNIEKEYFLDNLKYGITVVLEGTLSDPLNNTIPNTFNYKQYLYNKKIFKLLKISKIQIKDNSVSIINSFKNKLDDTIKNVPNSDYLKAFILGDKRDINNETFNQYRMLGVTHLFAISGMHIGLFAAVTIFVLKKLRINKNLSLILTIILLGFYGGILGYPASVRRAYIFFTLLTLNKIFKLNIKTINLLLLTIIINILINPFIIYDIGFIYSCLTTLGLIINSNRLQSKNYFIKLFKVSLVAFLYSLPVTINNFYEVNLMTPLNNIIIVPLVSLVIYPLCILTYIFPFLCVPLNWTIILLNFLANILSKINFLNVNIPLLPIYLIIIYYLIIYISFKYQKYYYNILIIIIFVARILSFDLDSNGYVYFFDIGQGDSALIIAPYRKTIVMIDTGGKLYQKEEAWQHKNKTYQVSDNTILFMKSIGINHIDELILSHGDADHAGDALNVINKIKVNKLTLNVGNKNDLESCLPIISNPITYQNMTLVNLNQQDYNEENANSQINYINIYNTNFLFMGDATKKQERDILNKYKLNVDIIKLGHHGSNTSSDYNFLKSINPTLSIISSGRNNRFNHPSKETIETLHNLNLSFLNTQTSGTIEIKIDHNSFTKREYVP
jgi:competence protein ComEC